MEGKHNVFLSGNCVGTVSIVKQGLYYRFSCRCKLPKDDLYDLVACHGNAQENLGVMVPLEGAFGMDTAVAAKRLGTDCVSFIALARSARAGADFVQVKENEPFSYIHELKNARLEIRGDQIGVVIER